MSIEEQNIAYYRSTEGVVRVLVERLVDQKKLVSSRQAMCRISVGPQLRAALCLEDIILVIL